MKRESSSKENQYPFTNFTHILKCNRGKKDTRKKKKRPGIIRNVHKPPETADSVFIIQGNVCEGVGRKSVGSKYGKRIIKIQNRHASICANIRGGGHAQKDQGDQEVGTIKRRDGFIFTPSQRPGTERKKGKREKKRKKRQTDHNNMNQSCFLRAKTQIPTPGTENGDTEKKKKKKHKRTGGKMD